MEGNHGYGNDWGYGDGYCGSSGYGGGDSYDGYSNGYSGSYGRSYGGNGNGYSGGDGYGSSYDGNSNGYSGYSTAGIKSINGMPVHSIDGIYTAISTVIGNVAKGYAFGEYYILEPCYIVKGGGYFAHGKTVREANSALQRKIMDNMPIDDRISLFFEHFETGKKYKAQEFYDWHGRLTGSCEFGRDEFIKRHGISLDDDMTVDRFIELTLNDYGGGVIKRLKEKREENKNGLQ